MKRHGDFDVRPSFSTALFYFTLPSILLLLPLHQIIEQTVIAIAQTPTSKSLSYALLVCITALRR